MSKEQRIGINDVPSELVRLHILTDREQEVLQDMADGYPTLETADALDMEFKEVQTHMNNISRIGITESRERKPIYPDPTVIALIQDGIINGYLHHELPIEPIDPITLREAEVLDLWLQGFNNAKIGQRLGISAKTVKIHRENSRTRLDTRNLYHTAARTTYMKVHGMWPSPK